MFNRTHSPPHTISKHTSYSHAHTQIPPPPPPPLPSLLLHNAHTQTHAHTQIHTSIVAVVPERSALLRSFGGFLCSFMFSELAQHSVYRPFRDAGTNSLAVGASWMVTFAFFVAFLILSKTPVSHSAVGIVLVWPTLSKPDRPLLKP